MKNHRKLFLGLGVTTLLGLAAPSAHAETMTLSVYLNGSSSAIYSTTGTAQSVTADVSALNAALNSGSTMTGYSFSSLSGASDYPGIAGPTGGYASLAGGVSIANGATGGTLTIVVTEDGFTAPISGKDTVLSGSATAIYSGATTSSTQTYQGTFTDNTPMTVNTPLTTQASTNGNNVAVSNSTSPVGPYAVPYTLTDTTTINLSASTGVATATDVFTGKTSIVTTAVPEPASLIMMVTGMPLPLVVMGLLRRRRGAA